MYFCFLNLFKYGRLVLINSLLEDDNNAVITEAQEQKAQEQKAQFLNIVSNVIDTVLPTLSYGQHLMMT